MIAGAAPIVTNSKHTAPHPAIKNPTNIVLAPVSSLSIQHSMATPPRAITMPRHKMIIHALIVIFIIIGLLCGFMMADVDNWGHIGGFIFGVVVSYILLKGDNNEDI